MNSHSKMGKGMATDLPPRDLIQCLWMLRKNEGNAQMNGQDHVLAPSSIACCYCPRQRYQSRWAIGLTQ